ncbi:MAG: SDR family oxidoreductase, partial [Acidobacteriota bacterium]
CERLLADGHEVICVDNLFTGVRSNIRQLLEHEHFEFLRHDVVQPMLIDCDQIYHLACPASPVHYQHNPVKTIQTNVVGTYNMLELARQVGARILQTSTSEVYGDPVVHPQPETYWGNVNPIGPRACYDEGKRCAETLLTDYHLQNGVEIRIARIFNTYGPRMAFDDGRVISNFAVQALTGKPVTLFGDGQQTRCFCYVDDTVDGLVRLMHYEGDEASEPVNIGHPGEVSMRQLAEMICEIVGAPFEVDYKPLPTDDPRKREPDITRARRRLGWSPRTELSAGLRRTISDFSQRIANR